ncbi:hypothetical protein CAP35_02650 [Chitinophagaceae bacterium IBVUCB1]|nr:hypothetical protein CAP35_02650 [Chitinophagaceae bacterium IBVUCB1]
MQKPRSIHIPFISILLIIMTAVAFQSCSNAKKVTYFQNVPDSISNSYTISEHTYVEPVIQVNDQLYVTVQTIDVKPSGTETSTGVANEKNSTYIVDKNGMIEVPLVGRVNVLGQTTTQAKETIRGKAAKYYVDPIINVRLMNFYINIIGDVTRPGKYNIVDEKTSILDALAMAGDMSITGKRNNVMLIREEQGQKRFVRFDFNSTNIFTSPYYFLRSGDVIYVEPLKAKSRSATTDYSKDRWLSIATSIISLFALTYTIVSQSNNN